MTLHTCIRLRVLSITHLTLKLRTFKVKDKGSDGELIKVYIHLGTMNLNTDYTFDLETWNLQGQGQRSRWKQLMKVYLHLMCERVIDHGLGTMKLNANYTFDLETWKHSRSRQQRSRWKELVKVHLHLKCESY